MKKFLLLLLVVLFVFTACDNTLKPIRFAFGGRTNYTDEELLKMPLTIKFTSDGGGTIIINKAPGSMKYSSNNGDKKEIPQGGIKAIKNEEIQLYANGTENENKKVKFPYLENALRISITPNGNGGCEVYGNVMSLLCDPSDTNFENFSSKTSVPKNAFRELFYNNKSITNAENLLLPATDLTGADDCYALMFAGCGLSKAPKLPATTLAAGCYQYMFYGCKNLEGAPELPAADLTGANRCYASMFAQCENLKLAENYELPATTLAEECYTSMFSGCTSLEEVSYNLLPAKELVKFCYTYMFKDCISLKNAPELPAKTLFTHCYQYMFNGCENLESLTCLAKTAPSTEINNYTRDWLTDAGTAVGEPKFYYATDDKWPENKGGADYGIPEGWVQCKINEKTQQ